MDKYGFHYDAGTPDEAEKMPAEQEAFSGSPGVCTGNGIPMQIREQRAALPAARTCFIILGWLAVLALLGAIAYALMNPASPAAPAPTATPVAAPRRTPAPTKKPAAPQLPYVGMRVNSIPSAWEYRGTDNLSVKDASGNKVRTTKYVYEKPPKQYTIWVNESDTVVKVDIYDRSYTAPKSTSKPKATSDPYNAKDYAHPEDFYEWYADDFWDYEDAEDYWEAHH